MSHPTDPVPSRGAVPFRVAVGRPVTVTVVVAALVLIVVTVLVVLDPGPLPGLDTALAATVTAGAVDPVGAGGSAVAVWSAVTALGAGPVLGTVGVLAAGVLAAQRRWAEAARLLAAMAAVFGGWALLRLTVARPRPEGGLVATSTDVGFPSGHASNAAAFAVLTVAILAPRLARPGRALLGVGVGLFALAVGVSRVVLGVHYPSDVLAGWALALAVAPTALRLAQRAPVNAAARRRTVDNEPDR